MGWDKDFLQSAIDQCTNLSGMIQDCPLFDIATVQEMHSCTVPKVQVQEEVEGPLDKLPGCNAIVYGTERVTPEQQCPEAKPEDPKPQVENVKTQQVAVKSQVESSTSTTLVPVVTSSSTIAQVETRLPVIDPNVVEVVVTITSWETVNVYATAPPVKPSGVVRRRHGHMGMHKKIHGRS